MPLLLIAFSSGEDRGEAKKQFDTFVLIQLDIFALIQFDIFVSVAHEAQVAFKVGASDYYCAAAVVWMERQSVGILQVGVEKQVYVVFGIVDESERRYAAGFQS